MTAAHCFPGVLMRRCRGARAVATFNGGVESRNASADGERMVATC